MGNKVTKVLILNHDRIRCGTYQFCTRIYNLVSESAKIDYYYKEIGCGDVSTYANSRKIYQDILSEIKPDFEIINWHWDRMPWLLESDLVGNKNSKHYFIWHDGSIMQGYDKYLFFGCLDPSRNAIPDNKRVLLPRPLYNYTGEYRKNNIITIGSFGFPFLHKRFPDLVKIINNTFDKAYINIHMPNPYFGDTPGNSLLDIIRSCRANNTKPNVVLTIGTEFVDSDAILRFLAGNDINIFYYDLYYQVGLSSAIDYALSVKRPIAITNHTAFRHIVSDEILIEKNSIIDILNRGTKPLQKYYDAWSTDKFVLEMDSLFA